MKNTLEMNIDDILEIATAMEEEGTAFYSAVAAHLTEPFAKDLFEALVRAESRHKELFEAMREQVRKDPTLLPAACPEDTISGFLRTWAKDALFGGLDPQRFVEDRTAVDLIKLAMGLEQEAIDFYSDFRELLASGAELQWLDKIIEQEQRHRRGLERVLNRIEGTTK